MAKKRKKKMSPDMAVPMSSPDREARQSVSVRKIKNGFLSSRSGHLDDPYKSEDTFHPTKPTVKVSVKDKKARDARLMKAKL